MAGEFLRRRKKDDHKSSMRMSWLLSAATLGRGASFSSITWQCGFRPLAEICNHQRSIFVMHSSSSDYDATDLVSVAFKTASGTKTIQLQKGELLRSAMLKQDLSPHNGRSRLINCRGLGTCGTCAVEIFCDSDSGIEPRERNTKENLRLNFPPHGSADQSPALRLACQVQVFDDIVVKKRTGFWGQDTDGNLSEGYNAELWFGDLEYLLDNRSPTSKDQ